MVNKSPVQQDPAEVVAVQVKKWVDVAMSQALHDQAESAARSEEFRRASEDLATRLRPLLEEAVKRTLLEKRGKNLQAWQDAVVTALTPSTARFAAAPEEVLTTEQAAQLLQVSRATMTSLLDSGKLGDFTKTEGGHRRISRAAVLAYKERRKASRLEALENLTELSQRMGLYDDELDQLGLSKDSAAEMERANNPRTR